MTQRLNSFSFEHSKLLSMSKYNFICWQKINKSNGITKPFPYSVMILVYTGMFPVKVFLFRVLYAINLQGRNIWNTLHVTHMSKAISAAESETSSLCEWRQHPSTLHGNNLPALFNLHTSLPPPSLLYLQNSLRWDAMRLLSCLAFVWKSNWELLFSLIHFHANKEVVFLFSCKCLFYRRRQV